MSINKSLKYQSLFFCVISLLVSLFFILGFSKNTNELNYILLLVILFFGMPHGALDITYARDEFKLLTLLDWFKFTSCYLFLAALVVLFWAYLPVIFLMSFLLFSALHFADDLDSNLPIFAKIVYGGTIVIYPTFFNEAETLILYQQLSGIGAALFTSKILTLLAYPWILFSVIIIVIYLKKNIYLSLEFFCILILSASTSPLVFFVLYFCVMHSLRHILNTKIYFTSYTYFHLIKDSFIPLVATFVMIYLFWFHLRNITIENRTVQVVFISLAALTVPHMLLISRSKRKMG